MGRIFRRKLLRPTVEGLLPRPRLLADPAPVRLLQVESPAGSGKTVFLSQWAASRHNACLWYELDESDSDGQVFLSHLAAGLQTLWPDWDPPPLADPAELAAELVAEAAGRPPLDLVLDRLEFAFAEAYLADFLATLIRYALPSLTLALSSRSPLPVDAAAVPRGLRAVTAGELAFTREEARELLPGDGWQDCFDQSGGLPLALELWPAAGENWRTALMGRMLGALPPHLSPELGSALVGEWLEGRMTLEAFAHQTSRAKPPNSKLWKDLEVTRDLFTQGSFHEALDRLAPLWDAARGRGDRRLSGAIALQTGDNHYGLGDYTRATAWYHTAFEQEPMLEVTGLHNLPMMLLHQGYGEEADQLGRRCVAACESLGDLQALVSARMQWGMVLAELGQYDEAERQLAEAERVGVRLQGDPWTGIVGIMCRAQMEGMRGNFEAFRRLAEEAYRQARIRSPYLTAVTGCILAGALGRWGELEQAAQLTAAALDTFNRLGEKFISSMMLVLHANSLWASGNVDEARAAVDQALRVSAAHGYVNFWVRDHESALPLLIDALRRGVEAAYCQQLLARVGERAVPALVDLTAAADPAVRRASLYPLAATGGEAARDGIRRLLHDEDESVRDAALLALRSLGDGTGPDRGAEALPTPAPAANMPVVEASMLGPMVVTARGQKVASWRTTKSRDILACLLLAGDHPVTRDQLIEALWPESDPEAAHSLLHTALYNLRRVLGPEMANLITFAGGAYRVDLSLVDLDLVRFRQLAQARDSDEAALKAAADLYRGDLLAGLDYPWCEAPRTRLRSQYLDVLRRLAEIQAADGRPAEAAGTLQLLVHGDPLAEDAHVALMRAYLAMGNRSAALQQYRTLQRLLDDELGLTPGPAAQDLYQKLLD